MDSLSDTAEELRAIMEYLASVRGKTEKRIQVLWEHKKKVQDKAADEADRTSALFSDIRRQLEELEERVLGDISRQKEKLLLSISDMVQQLEIKNDELSMKIQEIEELCNVNDQSSALQDHKWKVEKILEAGDDLVDLDRGQILVTLHLGLADIITAAKIQLCASELTLDVRTAAQDVAMLGDLKTAQTAEIDQHRLESPQRFRRSLVLSEESFSSGRHFWEMEISTYGVWYVGVCYASMEKEGPKSWLGNNDKSWYAGQLSFYELGNPIRHIYTFTATFTKPLHAAFALCRNSWVKIRN
uniref:B30.2/SPRY domain-containing protein n=1 Tax=Pyxicephalus adspersus TaxID=30357 RepID=A0AAV3B5L3_PYXAD|nr:TPA: hypothetical protein GDO54_006374 [Pyxicephalus adspersus]